MNALRDMRTISQLLGDAERIAREMGEEEPSAEHLLISAIRLRDGSAARVLGRFGIDADVARRMSAPEPLHPPVGRGLYRASASADEAFTAAGSLARGGASAPERGTRGGCRRPDGARDGCPRPRPARRRSRGAGRGREG